MPNPSGRERDVIKLFAKALRRLGQAGQPEEANRLAAQAWWALKDTDPDAAEHINGVMHYLARLQESDLPAPKTTDQLGSQAP